MTTRIILLQILLRSGAWKSSRKRQNSNTSKTPAPWVFRPLQPRLHLCPLGRATEDWTWRCAWPWQFDDVRCSNHISQFHRTSWTKKGSLPTSSQYLQLVFVFKISKECIQKAPWGTKAKGTTVIMYNQPEHLGNTDPPNELKKLSSLHPMWSWAELKIYNLDTYSLSSTFTKKGGPIFGSFSRRNLWSSQTANLYTNPSFEYCWVKKGSPYFFNSKKGDPFLF